MYFDRNKFEFKKLSVFLNTCATCSELPFDISTKNCTNFDNFTLLAKNTLFIHGMIQFCYIKQGPDRIQIQVFWSDENPSRPLHSPPQSRATFLTFFAASLTFYLFWLLPLVPSSAQKSTV